MNRHPARRNRSLLGLLLAICVLAQPAIIAAQDTGTGGPSGIEIVWSNLEAAPPTIAMEPIAFAPTETAPLATSGNLIPFDIVYSFPDAGTGALYELRVRIAPFVNSEFPDQTLDPATVSFAQMMSDGDPRLAWSTATPVASGDGLWHTLVSIDLTSGGAGIFSFYAIGETGDIPLDLEIWNDLFTMYTGTYIAALEFDLVPVSNPE